jgi:YggT family protein
VQIVVFILQLYLLLLLGRIALSWFPVSPDGAMARVQRFLFAVTEPVLAPIRALLPPVRFGATGIDLSPLILLFGLSIIIGLLSR